MSEDKPIQRSAAEYAFPHNNLSGQRGLSLRDYFAAKAMQGWLSTFEAGENVVVTNLASFAYLVADAMLAAREKQG